MNPAIALRFRCRESCAVAPTVPEKQSPLCACRSLGSVADFVGSPRSKTGLHVTCIHLGRQHGLMEMLALIQNSPTVFAKQANISNGPQQVNNGVPGPEQVARAKTSDSPPNGLLEAHGERWTGGTADSTCDRNQNLAPVGA